MTTRNYVIQLFVLVALIFGATLQAGCGPEVIPVAQQPQAVLRLTAETQTAAVGEEVLIESTVTGGAWDVPINGNPVLDRASVGEAVLVDGVWYMPVGGQYATYPVVGVPYVAPTTLVQPSPYVYWDSTRYVIIGSGMCYPVSYETVPQTRAYVSPVGPAATAASAKFSATAPDVYIVRCRTVDGQVAHITVRVVATAVTVGGRVTINITGSLVAGEFTIDLGDLVVDLDAIPADGVVVRCDEFGIAVLGRIIRAGGGLVFRVDASGLDALCAKIALGISQQVTLQFIVGGATYTVVVNVQGTQTPTPSPIVITLPNGTVVTDGVKIDVDTNGTMFLVQGGGPYSVEVLAGPFVVQVIDGAFLATPITGTAPGTYSVIIQITDACGQTRVIHITLVVQGSVTPVATGVTVSPPGPLTLNTNTTRQFTGSVQPANANQAVAWSCTRGNITANGLYTAPSTGGADQVICVSVTDSSVYRLVDVNVVNPTGGATVTVEGATR